jgi:hypothetical protein
MIITTKSKEWNVNIDKFKVFYQDINQSKITLDIPDNIFENIINLLNDINYINKLSIIELLHTYNSIDYLQIECLMEPCVYVIAYYMNKSSSKKLKKYLNILK